MHDTMNAHLPDDDLVLHYYGEMEGAAAASASAHLAGCDDCRRNYRRLQQVLAAVDTVPAPALADDFERTVWARLEPALPVRTGWLSWPGFSPANLAWAAMIVLLVTGAFIAGRFTTPPLPGSLSWRPPIFASASCCRTWASTSIDRRRC